MRTIPAGFTDLPLSTLFVSWKVVRRDGEIILGTECDENIPITTGALSGTYLARAGITGSDIRSSSDLSVDNLEVTGALQESGAGDTSTGTSLTLIDLSASDIEAGMFDNAECSTFLVNSANPDLYQHLLRTGWLGNVTRDSNGQYKTELRGLTQALSQSIVKTYGVSCQWELGSTPSSSPPGLCRVDMTPFTYNRSVTVVTDRRNFQIDSSIGVTQIAGGKVTWTSGLNAGRVMEIKSYGSLQMELYLPMPSDITIGDTLEIKQGCDKQHLTCINQYNNIENFGGWGIFVPGDTEILKVGKK